MEIFDKKGGDITWYITCSILFLTTLASLASFFYVLDECGDTPSTTVSIGVYDAELNAYCSQYGGAFPAVEYKLPDGSVTYVTSCEDAKKYGIVE